MRLILLGGPGVGKGTQASLLEEHLKVPHISTGEIFRENIRAGTPLGVKVREYIEAGKLVPDDITVEMVSNRLLEDDCNSGYILDGFPRTIPQAEAIGKILRQAGTDIDFILSIELPDDVIVKRLAGRRVCPDCGETYHIDYKPSGRKDYCDKCGAKLLQRSDDHEQTIRERLANYHRQTAPLLDYYGKTGKLRVINGEGGIDDVFSRIMAVLGEK
jgi:adenylate kinase